MLNQNKVLKYVKTHLGFPFVQVEMEDDDILDHIKDFTLQEWTYYLPEKKRTSINTGVSASKVPGSQNEFYIIDADNLEILNVVDIYLPASDLLFHGHPYYNVGSGTGPSGMVGLKEWALAVSSSMMMKMFSTYDTTWEFRHPNVIRISPVEMVGEKSITIEYEREQPHDFSGIRNDVQIHFLKLASADIKILIGTIRKKYQNTIRTPFGEIPLEDILQEGKDEKRELLEKLELSLPNITLERG